MPQGRTDTRSKERGDGERRFRSNVTTFRIAYFPIMLFFAYLIGSSVSPGFSDLLTAENIDLGFLGLSARNMLIGARFGRTDTGRLSGGLRQSDRHFLRSEPDENSNQLPKSDRGNNSCRRRQSGLLKKCELKRAS